MKRRSTVLELSPISLVSRAQQGDRMRRVGIVMPYPKGDTEYEIRVRALRQELAKLGWRDERDR
jgi:hypothetical protein